MKLEDVKQYNGKDGNPAYVVYEGYVYDVTDSKLWKNGSHMNRHPAGENLTEFMSMAKHGPEVLERFKKVCKLEEPEPYQEQPIDKFRQLFNKIHPHPVLLHYPIGVIIFGAVMLMLFLLTGQKSFEETAYYSLAFGTITAYPVVLTGIISWWLNYEMMRTKIFKIKLYLSIVLLIFCSITTFIRCFYPDLIFSNNNLMIYYLTYFSFVPCIMTIAYNGGKITWPN